jgi:hypothetical protein
MRRDELRLEFVDLNDTIPCSMLEGVTDPFTRFSEKVEARAAAG